MSGKLGWIDWALLLLYLAGTLGVGLWVGRKLKTGTDYFLAGRRLPWWAVGVSLVATDIGATDLIGEGGATYSFGLAAGNFEWIGCVPAMIVAAFVFIPFFHRTGVTTIPEYMERRFNPAMRTVLAVCLILFMACNLGVMLFASAKMISSMFGWSTLFSLLLTAGLCGIYTTSGGLAADVYTDVLQCFVMIAGCLAMAVLGIIDLGGVGPLIERVREIDRARGASDHLSLVLPVDTTSPFPWTGIFFGLALILSPAYWIGNQAIIQRSLGARSVHDARASFIAGALLKNVIPFVIAVPGLIALVKYPGMADGDAAIPTLAADFLPLGLRGLFLAAFLAALMSTVDSYLNSGSALLTLDLYKRFLRPQATNEQLLPVGRWTTAGFMTWGVLFGLWVGTIQQSGVYAVFQTLMAFFQGPLLAILLAGVLWRRATGAGALAGFAGGVVTSVSLFTLNLEGVQRALGTRPLFAIQAPFLYFSIWSFLAAAALIVGVSLLTRPEPEEKIRGFVLERRAAP
jgi:solute:Na+ symporter, SSS family